MRSTKVCVSVYQVIDVSRKDAIKCTFANWKWLRQGRFHIRRQNIHFNLAIENVESHYHEKVFFFFIEMWKKPVKFDDLVFIALRRHNFDQPNQLTNEFFGRNRNGQIILLSFFSKSIQYISMNRSESHIAFLMPNEWPIRNVDAAAL